jgi:hypothetical protein
MAEQSEQRQRYGYTDESGNRVSAMRDMFNGGGPGQSGTTFQGGGLLSDIGNALGGPGGFSAATTTAAGLSRPVDCWAALLAALSLALLAACLAACLVGRWVAASRLSHARQRRSIPHGTCNGPKAHSAYYAPPQLNTAPVNSAHTLTQQDIELLQKIGLAFNAMPGEPATQQEIDALGRYPTPMGAPMSAQPGFLSPPASTTATTDPRLLPIPTPDIADLEAYLSGQPAAMATSPMLSVPAMTSSASQCPTRPWHY